jgi:predicted hydrocarbon binding protein
MARTLDWRSELDRKGHQVVFSGQAIAMHCHHYNINLQKTLEDALGEQGVNLLYGAAEETIFHGLRSLFVQYPKISSLKSKLEMASILFQNCGLGIIYFQTVKPSKAFIVSTSSHHVTGWLAKHGKRETPGCHFTRGWIAGTLETIYRRPIGYFDVTETECKMKRDNNCVFHARVRSSGN